MSKEKKIKCKECEFKKEQEKIVEIIEKLGYKEIWSGIMSAEIILKDNRRLINNKRYFKRFA